MLITAVSTSSTAVCPTCNQVSQRIHSSYTRSPHDLQTSGQTVRLTLQVRRFRCQNQHCQRQTFAERLPGVVPLYAQRTLRLTNTLTLFAFVLSGQAGVRLLAQIGMTTSADTLVRLARQALVPLNSVPSVIGVDDFALRRGKTYGTIIVDLVTHRPIELLTERMAETLSGWLVEHPGVNFISRDRSSEYMRGATEGASHAQQVLDRWHVLNNVREVVQRIVG